jgi:hypothetical protein
MILLLKLSKFRWFVATSESKGPPLRFACNKVTEICDFIYIPIPDVLIKFRSRIEHARHIRHIRNVPTSDILVKGAKTEHTIHSSHIRNVPTSDILVEGGSLLGTY